MNGLHHPSIYLYREFVDFRKSINGLVMLIEYEPDLPMNTGALFLFTNRQRNKIKILYWDLTSFALWYKRLENNTFKWPSKEKGLVINITKFELERLLYPKELELQLGDK